MVPTFTHLRLALTGLLLTFVWTGCEGSLSSLSDDELSTGIPLSKQHYDLSSLSDEDAVITPSFTNERSDTVYYLDVSPINIQRLEKGDWNDFATWYLSHQMQAKILPLPPGETLSSPEIPPLNLTNLSNYGGKSGFYRFNFFIYDTPNVIRDSEIQNDRLLPEEERTSVPFEVIM
ncbi:MAG: hypothetical protein WEA36_04790 [Balneolaceae bacterium]